MSPALVQSPWIISCILFKAKKKKASIIHGVSFMSKSKSRNKNFSVNELESYPNYYLFF